MARNLKKENLRKLAAIETKNGYKIDIANYIYNPSLDHEYPGLYRTIEDSETKKRVHVVYYFKYYNGTGEYLEKTYSYEKAGELEKQSTWKICNIESEKVIEASNRFNLNKLIQIAETF